MRFEFGERWSTDGPEHKSPELKSTTFYEVLRLIVTAGNTSKLTLDEVAVDTDLRSVYGAGLHDPIVISKPEETEEIIGYAEEIE